MKISILATVLVLASISFAAPVSDTTVAPQEGEMFERRDEKCNDNFKCPLQDAYNAMNQFIARGTENCPTPANGQYGIIWQNGQSCVITAHATNGKSAASYCRDVGYGIRNLINSCSKDNFVGGNGNAGGNGDYGITLFGSS